MSINKVTIQNFKATYQKDFGIDLNEQDAHEVSTKLVGLFELLAKFYSEDEMKNNDNNK